ncbi:MAG TPA: response regulator transcription factor [Longimicrobiales bacterium]|nr:response regulator transcription factor [Longimicrobiales bacterium]
MGSDETSRTEAPAPESPARSIAIAIIEDNRVVLEGLSVLLQQVAGLEIVHAGSSANLSDIERSRPRVVLLDVGLENGDSLTLARRVGRELPDSRVVVMDLLPTEEDIRDFIEAGVSGFIMKDASLDELLKTIRTVAQGANVLPPPMTTSLFSQIAHEMVSRRSVASVDVGLTPREREVIDLISEGLSNKGIAARLHISVHTVKSHVRNVMEKLALHTRLQVAAWVHRGDGED